MNAKFCIALLGGAVTLSLTSARSGSGRGGRRAVALLVDVRASARRKSSTTAPCCSIKAGRVYVNRLDRECVGLARSGTFTYQGAERRSPRAALCDSDSHHGPRNERPRFQLRPRHVRADLGGRGRELRQRAESRRRHDARRAAEERRAGRAARRRACSAMKKAGPLARPGPSNHELSDRASRECRGA